MSYTAPQYVDTKEQAILALASTIKGEAVTGGDGSVNRALDILADVLAEQDVQVPQTDAGAILALAQYVSGGGGGGGDLTTAKLTLSVGGAEVHGIPLLNCSVMVDDPEDEIQYTDTIIAESGTYDAILYKGTAYAGIPAIAGYDVVSAQTSGNVVEDDLAFFITGDCAIALTLTQID